MVFVMTTKKELEKKVVARLAMTGDEVKEDWKKESERLIKRKKEAVLAMVSDEQKKLDSEQKKKQEEKLLSQKRLEDLRNKRKIEEEAKKKNIGQAQTETDLKAEKQKGEKIKEILQSQEQIKNLTKQKNNYLKPLKTLSSETIRAIKDEGLSSSKIAINNQSIIKKIPPKEPKKIGEIIVLVISVIFILASISIVGYFIITNKSTKNEVIATKNSILFVDKHIGIDLTGKDSNQINSSVINAIKQLDDSKPKEGAIGNFYFTETIKYLNGKDTLEKQVDITASQFIASSTQGIPSEFSRSLDDKFMLGIFQNGKSSPFFIFKTQYFKSLTDAMLKNESIIISNLYNLTGTTNVTSNIIGLPFKDKTVQNTDLRIAKKGDGETVVLYGFIDQNTVLIAENEEVFNKLLGLYKTQ